MQQCCIKDFYLYFCRITKLVLFMILSQKSDNFGAAASFLCLLHCLITPFIFVAQTCSIHCCAAAPSWWRAIDIFFLILSFFAVVASAKKTERNWLKKGLWLSCLCLAVFILNENLNLLKLAHEWMYVPAFSLIALHLFNKKACKKDCCY